MKFDLQWLTEEARGNQTPNQLRKGIRSLQKEIEDAEESIQNRVDELRKRGESL